MLRSAMFLRTVRKNPLHSTPTRSAMSSGARPPSEATAAKMLSSSGEDRNLSGLVGIAVLLDPASSRAGQSPHQPAQEGHARGNVGQAVVAPPAPGACSI